MRSDSALPVQTALPVDAALPADAGRHSLPVPAGSRESLRRRLLVIFDLAAATTTFVLLVDRFGLDGGALSGLAATPLLIAALALCGLYSRDDLRVHHGTLDEVPALLQSTAAFALAASVPPAILSARTFAAAQLTVLWLATFLAALVGRALARGASRRLVAADRCLIIGETARTDRIRARITASAAPATVVGCLTTGDLIGTEAGLAGVVGLVGELAIDRVIIVAGGATTGEVAQLIRRARDTGARLSIVPEVLETAGSAVALDELEGMVMLGLPRFGLGASARRAKRAFDLAVATAGLVVAGPLLVLIAAMIRLDSPGPVLFRQTRIGRHGRPLRIFKFRSMVADAEALKDRLRCLSIAGEGLFKLADDPRTTRVGRLLRATSLDELPQLLNVVRGEMTLVGPRPLVPDEDAQVRGEDRSRLLLTPGLTGPWQLMGSRVPLQEMVEIDHLYASSWSLWGDAKLVLRTLVHVVRGANL